MGKCKVCNSDTIGTKDICDKCEELRKEKSNTDESYLDSLLSSVANSQPVYNDGLKRKRKMTPVKLEEPEKKGTDQAEVAEELISEHKDIAPSANLELSSEKEAIQTEQMDPEQSIPISDIEKIEEDNQNKESINASEEIMQNVESVNDYEEFEENAQNIETIEHNSEYSIDIGEDQDNIAIEDQYNNLAENINQEDTENSTQIDEEVQDINQNLIDNYNNIEEHAQYINEELDHELLDNEETVISREFYEGDSDNLVKNEDEIHDLINNELIRDDLKVDEVNMKGLKTDNENIEAVDLDLDSLNLDSLDFDSPEADDLDVEGFDFDESNFDNMDINALEELDLSDFYNDSMDTEALENDFNDLDKLNIEDDLEGLASDVEEEKEADLSNSVTDYEEDFTVTNEMSSDEEAIAEDIAYDSDADNKLDAEEDMDIPLPDFDSIDALDQDEMELAKEMDNPEKEMNSDTSKESSLDPNEILDAMSEEGGVEDDDLMSLLDMLNLDNDNPEKSEEKKNADVSEEENGEDLFSLDDLFGSEESPEEKQVKESTEDDQSSDLGDIFSDVLGAVSSLDDEGLDDDLTNLLANGVEEEETGKGKKRKTKKAKKEKGEKKSIFKKLFSNIPYDEETLERQKKEEEEEELNREKKELEKKELAAKKAAEKEEKKKAAKEKKKEVKPKKEKPAKPKKEKKKPEETEEDLNPGKINRVGATLVLSFFLIIAIVILSVTDLFSYSTTIANATKFFDRQKYTQAYNEIAGVTVRPQDQELADKIKTVMFVNKQLNSYNNYYSMGKYPEALDSLIKGLERYEKHIEAAQSLGIQSDLDYVRGQILGELKSTYNLSEKRAMALTEIEDKDEYSENIYSVASVVDSE